MEKIKYHLLSILLYGVLVSAIIAFTKDHREPTAPTQMETEAEVTTLGMLSEKE